MRFLSRLRWKAATALPLSNNRPGPDPAWLPATADGRNPIHDLLDEIGLPWREARMQVEARLGIATDPLYARAALFFPDAVRLPGFMQSWRADVFERYAPGLPVVRFSGLASFGGDADDNIERLAAHVAERLGPASVGQAYNTLACRWRSGTASLELKCWPPAWQSRDLQNDAYAREPRLATACHLTLLTGFRLPLSEEEEGWIAQVRPLAEATPELRLPPDGPADVAPRDVEVEYARDAAGHWPRLRGSVGRSAGGEALILGTHQLFVVPARDVLGFEVTRMLPAKGGGGSSLSVRCRTPCPGVDYKRLHLKQHSDPDGVSILGQELAALFGTPCEISPYFNDV